jgi:hypothetical protein
MKTQEDGSCEADAERLDELDALSDCAKLKKTP